ncbi:MAG TPA: thioredoxin domain-containing protein [Gaiellaceae bacterium]|nr:thioredoxin domain-containing protein [Gaiellaceae bacterium]
MSASVPKRRPEAASPLAGRTILVALAAALAVAAALIAGALLLRDESDPAPAPDRPLVGFAGIPQQGTFLGSPGARVTLVEYADPQCPACRAYAERVLPTLVEEYVRTGKVRLEFRAYPFLGPDSFEATRYLLAAAEQDRLWELQELLYRHQGDENAGWVTDDLVRRLGAQIAGLDVERLFADAASERLARAADEAAAAAQSAGIPGTPTFIVRIGRAEPYAVQLGLEPAQFRAVLDDALRG